MPRDQGETKAKFDRGHRPLTDLFILRGVPAYIRSDNGPEFIAEALRDLIEAVGVKTASIKPGSPWENGYCESFIGRMRDELLNGEIFYSLREAQIIIERWRNHCNTKRPHSATAHLCQEPPYQWTKGQSYTNFQYGTLKWKCSFLWVPKITYHI